MMPRKRKKERNSENLIRKLLAFSYNIVYFILTYIVPIVAMGICYGQIGAVLWGKSIIRENACNDLAHERKLRSKRKVKNGEIKI